MTVDRGSYYVLAAQPVILSIVARDPSGGQYPESEYSWAASDPALSLAPSGPYEYTAVSSTAGSYVVTVTHTPTGDAETLTIVVQVPASGAQIGLAARTA